MSIIGATTINWEDMNKRTNIMWRVPRNIRFNDNIVVREDEIAVFYRDGKALAYIDRPDRYALTSLNAPIVGRIVKFLSGVQQQAEVIYLSKRVFDGKFGSKQPYQFRDKDFGMVNLRLFGEFRYKVNSPENFVTQFVGVLNAASSTEVEERLKEQMVILIYDSLGDLKEKGLGVADIASKLTDIEQVVLDRAKSHFELYGVAIDKVSGLYVSMPEEVQKAVDMRASAQVLGTSYIQYQAGQAMREAAQNPSGAAGAGAGIGVGIGAGMGMGYQMVGQLGAAQQPLTGAGAAGAIAPCPKCGALNATGAKFCNSCGAKLEAGIACPKCGTANAPETKFCANCGTKLQGTQTCPSCKAEIPAATKFCPECGKPTTAA